MLPLERTILRELLHRSDFAERVVPYIKEEYFSSTELSLIYRLYAKFYLKFHAIPQFAALRIGLDSVKKVTEKQAQDAREALEEIAQEPELDDTQFPWLMEQAEDWCQDKAVFRAIQEAIQIQDDPTKTRHEIAKVIKEALAVSFDSQIGHDFFDDADARFDYYHSDQERIPFDLSVFNTVTNGGVPKKTLNVAVAGTNVGKSLFLVHVAAAYLKFAKNVLYITMEMAEERIAERIDANLMNIPIEDLVGLSKRDFDRKIDNLRKTCAGKLIIKEYPTGAASVANFRALLSELKAKKNFVPDVIVIDYLTICASQHVKMGAAGVNSYSLYRFVAEEFRALAVEEEVPVWTAAQFNRTGFNSSDPGTGDIGESFGIPTTADFMFSLITNEELDKIGQYGVKVLKNRYAKKDAYTTHLVGVDTNRMKLYDLSVSQMQAAVNQMQPAPAATGSQSTFTKPGSRRKPLTSLKKELDV